MKDGNQWRPIDRLPPGQRVLLWIPSEKSGVKRCHCVVGKRSEAGMRFVYMFSAKPKGVPTHWMELPDDPADAEYSEFDVAYKAYKKRIARRNEEKAMQERARQ